MISLALFSVLIGLVWSQGPGPEMKDSGKISVDVYYFSDCGWADFFFQTQLKPTLKSIGDYIDLHMFPVGFEKEGTPCSSDLCMFDHVHACAIALLEEASEVVEIAGCLIEKLQQSYRPFPAADICSRSVGLLPYNLESCTQGPESTILLDASNNAAQKYINKKHLTSLGSPTVLINGDDSLYINNVTALEPILCNILSEGGNVPRQCQYYQDEDYST